MTDSSIPSQNFSSRRNFVKAGALGSAAVTLGMPFIKAAESSESKRMLRIGVVGVGGRGVGAVMNLLKADQNTMLWAVGDIFEKKVSSCVERVQKKYSDRVSTAQKDRQFVGFDAYQKVIDSGVDIVLLTSTPAFRPLHMEAAVAAGKHLFIEKPFALDAPGLRSVIESARQAQSNGKSVLTGLVWRYSKEMMEMKNRIEQGAIGDVLHVSSSYCGGRPNKMPDPKFKPPSMSDMEWVQRYWQNFLEFSGDGVMEYHIHGIDRMIWFMGDLLPNTCYATGGNLVPVPGANNWDNFSMKFEYEGGLTSDFFGRQVPGCYSAIGDIVTGTEGRAIASGKKLSIVNRKGETTWQTKISMGYVHEHEILTSHIRAGKIYNDVLGKMAHSHAAAMMGRTAGYTGKLITSDAMMKSKDLLVKDIKNLNFDTPFQRRETAHPSKTKFI